MDRSVPLLLPKRPPVRLLSTRFLRLHTFWPPELTFPWDMLYSPTNGWKIRNASQYEGSFPFTMARQSQFTAAGVDIALWTLQYILFYERPVDTLWGARDRNRRIVQFLFPKVNNLSDTARTNRIFICEINTRDRDAPTRAPNIRRPAAVVATVVWPGVVGVVVEGGGIKYE